MMIATNWGVFEFGERDPQFIEPGDRREMQIRARSAQHLDALREHFPELGENVYLGWGVADFQWRVYITRKQLSYMMYEITSQIDYIRFKEGAHNDHRLYGVLSRMWSVLLDAYPTGSSYHVAAVDRRPNLRHTNSDRPVKSEKKKRWWQDVRDNQA